MLRQSIVLLVAAISPALALWPLPIHSTAGNSTFFIDRSIPVTYNGKEIPTDPYEPPAGSCFKSEQIVRGAVSRAFGAVFEIGFVPWMIRDPDTDYEPPITDRRIVSLDIKQTEKDKQSNFRPIDGILDESYSLNITADGKASISAATSIGILRAMETFAQLFFTHSKGGVYTSQVPLQIQDEPTYPHRGILLDVSRHWYAVDDLKKTIDALSMAKMNTFHIHITDTQSWPLQIPALPRLSEKGAYHPDLTYSPKDIASLFEYGVHRGVQVILEIDMPGHMGVDKAYPGLSVAYNKRPYGYYCAQPPCGSLRLNNTDVEKFLDTLFDDLLPRVLPYSAYFHTGGDEYRANNSILDPDLKTNDVKILQPMLQRFLDHVHGGVRKHKLTPIVWEEMVLEWNATVGKDTLVQAWQGPDAVGKLANAGHKVIDSTKDYYYLDCGRGEWIIDHSATDGLPFEDWCSPTKNWRVVYSHDPRAGLSKDAAKNIVGGEVAVWSETIDHNSVHSIVWPRAAAAGEIWWSGSGVDRDMFEVQTRLSEMRHRMQARGVHGAAITQQWCEQRPAIECSSL